MFVVVCCQSPLLGIGFSTFSAQFSGADNGRRLRRRKRPTDTDEIGACYVVGASYSRFSSIKHTLDGKSGKEKENHVSIQIAEQFNAFLEEIKKEAPEAAPHLPQPITWQSVFATHMRLSDIRFLELEMLINQVLAVLDVVRANR